MLWDFAIQTDKKLEHNKPDLTIVDKEKKICYIVDVACPFDSRICSKEKEKEEKYNKLKYEIIKIGKMKKVVIIPIVIGALGTVTKNIKENLEKMEIKCEVNLLQKATLLGTARIIRKVLDQ